MCSHSQSAGKGNTLLMKDGKVLTISDVSSVDVLNCDTLKSVRQDMLMGIWPQQCKRCQDESAVGSNSRDRWETERHRHSFSFDMARNVTAADGTVSDIKFQDFDLRIGNQCNLRCVMCFPGETAQWYDDHQTITGADNFIVDDKVYDLRTSRDAFGWSRDKNNIDALINASENLLKINFGGGEPLLIKHHRYLLESMISAGYAQQMELEYSTNLTFFPPDLFALWKNFKRIRICASIDAVGNANEAIRYHSKWDTIVNNLHMLDRSEDNISVFVSTSVSTVSLEHYGRLMSWVRDQKFKKIHEHASHLVYNPRYFNIAILEHHQLEQMIMHSRVATDGHAKMNKKLDHYQNIYHTIKMPDQEAIEHRRRFVEVWDKFQKNQSQDWDQIFPIASGVVKEWSTKYND
jgi:hypothetical protein